MMGTPDKAKGWPLGFLLVLLFFLSIILTKLCISYREVDWITGGLLFMAFFGPALLLEMALMALFFLSGQAGTRNIAFWVNVGTFLFLLAVSVAYVFGYN